MLALLLRADGWQVAYLGADTPVADSIALAGGLGARLVAVSATMPENLSALRRSLDSADTADSELVVGGRALAGDGDLGGRARAMTGDLREAVRELRRFAS